MEKEWLIRTKNNHILGPVSRKKIKELIENGTVKGDDEICSGNGYWIHIRESDLIVKYLDEENEQSFNPVQEARNSKKLVTEIDENVDGEDRYPDEADLEFPEVDEKAQMKTEVTSYQPSSIPLNSDQVEKKKS